MYFLILKNHLLILFIFHVPFQTVFFFFFFFCSRVFFFCSDAAACDQSSPPSSSVYRSNSSSDRCLKRSAQPLLLCNSVQILVRPALRLTLKKKKKKKNSTLLCCYQLLQQQIYIQLSFFFSNCFRISSCSFQKHVYVHVFCFLARFTL